MTQALDDLSAAVATLTTAVSAAAGEIAKQADAIKAAAATSDSAAIEAAVTQIAEQAKALNAAVAASDPGPAA